jgi:LruC domain-containing protein
MKITLTYLILCFALLFSCKKENKEPSSNSVIKDPSTIFEMKVPDGFNYENAKNVIVQIQVLNRQDKPGLNVIVTLSTNAFENGGKILIEGKTNSQGIFTSKLRLPVATKQIICNTSLLGIPENVIIPVVGNNLMINLGGSNPLLVQTAKNNLLVQTQPLFKNAANLNGVPNNLVTPRDIVSNTLLNDIWAALPSRVSVAVNRPTWLDDNITKRTLPITQTADVWVTFLTEGAGYRNTLFYYKYHKNFPPATAAAIDSLYIVFPNASLTNSNGGLLSGDKVSLGRFGLDTIIAFGIASNGFNATTGTLSNGLGVYYAHKEFNPEPSVSLKQHMVMLLEPVSSKFIMGFEDVARTSSGCDHDFNDVLFYTTCNPITAISKVGIAGLPSSADDDGDGVNNVDDEYPSDPLRAFNSYYPAFNEYATLAFEDLWPYYGDYDLNDVIIDFNYKLVSNAQNEVKDVVSKFTLRASGGQIENAFAVEYPALASNVSNVTGGTLEGGQPKTVIKVINNIRAAQGRWNTILAEPYADTVNYNVSFTLNTPIAIATFGINEYNPFIWGVSNGTNRGMEIHLPGKLPTALAADSNFSKGDDRTNRAQNKYYLSKDNFPWALLIPQKFDYPYEKKDIVTAYLKFGQWAQSNGLSFPEWYKNYSGYRVPSKIYSKP